MEDTTVPPSAGGEEIHPGTAATGDDRQKEIAEIASHVYEVREGREGDPVEDWLKAEAILARKEQAAATEQPLVDHSKYADSPKP